MKPKLKSQFVLKLFQAKWAYNSKCHHHPRYFIHLPLCSLGELTIPLNCVVIARKVAPSPCFPPFPLYIDWEAMNFKKIIKPSLHMPLFYFLCEIFIIRACQSFDGLVLIDHIVSFAYRFKSSILKCTLFAFEPSIPIKILQKGEPFLFSRLSSMCKNMS